MSAVHTREATQQPAKETKKTRMFNIYPVLGIVLVLLAAALVYGGLLIFLLEDWNLFESAGQGAAVAR